MYAGSKLHAKTVCDLVHVPLLFPDTVYNNTDINVYELLHEIAVRVTTCHTH